MASSDISSYRRSSTSLAPSTVDTSLPGSTSTRHLSLSPIDGCFPQSAHCPPQYYNAQQQDSHSPSFSSHSLSPYAQPSQFAELSQHWPHQGTVGSIDMSTRSITEPFPSASHFTGLVDDFAPGNLTLPKQNGGRMVRNLSAQDLSSASRRQQNAYHPYSTSPQQQRRSTGNAIGLSHMHPAAPQFDGANLRNAGLQDVHGLDLYGFTVTSASDAQTLPPRYTAMIPRPIDVSATYSALQQPQRTVSPTLMPTGLVQPASATASSFSSSPTAHTVMISRNVSNQSYDSAITLVEDPDATLVDTSFLSPSSYNKKDIIIPGLPQQDFSTESARWKAVQNRTHMADSHFVCAHLTTRVFCRPSCVAKKPERLRTTYFNFPGAIEAAESAGFRPCKRCKPEIPGTADNSALAVGQCIKQIVNETEQVFNGGSVQLNDEGEMKNKTLKEYSKLAGLSPFHFHRCFKAVAAITPGEFVRAHTALTLQDRLGMDSHAQPLSAPQVEQTMLGWTIRRARKTLGGALPAMYARGCPDMDVQAIHADTTAGRVAFAYVEFGLDVGPPVMLACMLGDDAVERVTKRFPGIKLREDATSWLKGVVDEVMKSAGREVQLPQSYVGHVRRARIAVSIRDELEAAVARHRAEQSFPAKSA